MENTLKSNSKIFIFGLGILTFLGILYFLNAALPIGAGYSAKYLCSHVFLGNRDPKEIFEREIKPTHPLFATATYEVDYEQKMVVTKAFGVFKKTVALYREGVGCTLVVNETIENLKAQSANISPRKVEIDSQPYLENSSNKADLQFNKEKLNSLLDSYLKEPSPTSNRNTRAILISQNGEIISEKYSKGINETSVLLGWSMTKSVINALMGILVQDKKFSIQDSILFPQWKEDNRKSITIDNLLRMSSGLNFEEEYAPLKDATYMLYSSKSTSDYAIQKSLKVPPGSEWYYSSGTTNILSRLIFDANGGTLEKNTKFLRERLLDKLNMKTAILEPDSSGVIIGSSYMFASARDWARFGFLYLQDGIFNGERILPEGWVTYSTSVTDNTPLGEYGAQIWLNRGNPKGSETRKFPKLPEDLYYFGGYNKQIVAIIPSKKMVIVRLGVTTDGTWNHETFIDDVLNTIVSK